MRRIPAWIMRRQHSSLSAILAFLCPPAFPSCILSMDCRSGLPFLFGAENLGEGHAHGDQ